MKAVGSAVKKRAPSKGREHHGRGVGAVPDKEVGGGFSGKGHLSRSLGEALGEARDQRVYKQKEQSVQSP